MSGSSTRKDSTVTKDVTYDITTLNNNDNEDKPRPLAYQRRASIPVEQFLVKSAEELSHNDFFLDLEGKVFELLANQNGKVSVAKFLKVLNATGLQKDDPRLREMMDYFTQKETSLLTSHDEIQESLSLIKKEFKDAIRNDISIISSALKNEFVIPEWKNFVKEINRIHDLCKDNKKGLPAQYIPQLARVDPNLWGVSVCTIDGQRHSIGDTNKAFCLQSTSKPLNYALVLSDLSADVVHAHVGQEPSGRSFNELTLNHENKPHNPMINAGAIAITSLLKTTWNMADRFDYINEQYKRMAGGLFIGFSNATKNAENSQSGEVKCACESLYERLFLSERDTADRNFALAYFMQENKVFPKEAKLIETLELYFQLCSVEVNCESASVIAATLANGGICPLNGERVVKAEAVRNTLSLMHSCGMYDYSGQFAFKVGLPAKSGVSGLILLVIPNVMGIATWSPALDVLGNSCRGIQFCDELIKTFNFHNYDNLKHTAQKKDPRVRELDLQSTMVVNLLFGAAHGDLGAIQRFSLQGIDMTQSDYDGRTALHLAAAEGQLEIVKFLVEKSKVPLNPRDRWGFSPMDDALRFEKNPDVVKFLEEKLEKEKA